ncbi:VOC family protein [Candidatus Methanoperedens nitratireducens]
MNPVVHFEMPAKDKGRMRKFYETAFGWLFPVSDFMRRS